VLVLDGVLVLAPSTLSLLGAIELGLLQTKVVQVERAWD
jgi:hypothetical protein